MKRIFETIFVAFVLAISTGGGLWVFALWLDFCYDTFGALWGLFPFITAVLFPWFLLIGIMGNKEDE